MDRTRPGGECPTESVAALGCLRRIRRWRVPPRWSERDWFEEISAETAAAALQARRDFDPARGVPWEAFLRRRVMYSALARYRREWAHAIRRVSLEVIDDYGSPGANGLPHRETVARLIQEALGRLPRADALIIEGLFWGGKTEAGLADSLGITQQAVNKRKRTIFRTLHRVIETLAKDLESWL
jgi:DNA-directed RNA polymerase specialized sigma24 family protein